jgi:hypothetical protein
MLKDKIKKKSNNKRIKNYSSQPELKYQTRDLSHETKITQLKEI